MSGATLSLTVSSATPRCAAADERWQPVRAGGIEWWIRGDCVGDLVGASGLHWEEWKREGAIEIVKTGPHRTVYRLNLAAGEFYLKHFRIADWQAWLRNLVRPSPAERELNAVLRIAALRLPTFEPVGFGRSRRAGVTCDTFLVSRAIPEALPLDHFLLTEFPGIESARQAGLRQRLARELGLLAARLHQAGVEHIDLHAGNLLIRPDESAEGPLLALIDLHAVRFRGALSRWRRDRNLAALHQFFAGRTTRADRGRFWKAYREGIAGGPLGERSAGASAIDTGAAARIEDVLACGAHAGWRRADRAWRRGNRHVRKLNSSDVDCRGLAALDVAWLEAIRDAPETLFDRHIVRWCKQSSRHRVAEVAIPSVADELRSADGIRSDGAGKNGEDASPPATLRAFWKAITERRSFASLFARWRLSPVRRAWEVGHALLRRGIDTPRPLLFVESAREGERRLYFLTEAVPQGVALDEFFGGQWKSFTAAERRDWLSRHAQRMARQVSRLHDSGFDHRDLKFPNLLVSTDPADDRVWLLDLDAVREWRRLPRIRAMQNLSRLSVSSCQVEGVRSTDRLRFLRTYLGPRFANEWKTWWRSIARRSSHKITRNVRNARPLS